MTWLRLKVIACPCPSVRNFSGNTVIHVGEWRGDTGDARFEAELASGWELQTRLPLPCWGDTVEDLTVWTRRASRLSPPPKLHPVLTCDACGHAAPLHVNGAGGGADAGRPLRRCRYCRLACYCSAACAATGSEAHARYHAIKLINVQRPLDFFGRDYCPLP